jgi:hypothetical protein
MLYREINDVRISPFQAWTSSLYDTGWRPACLATLAGMPPAVAIPQ